MVYQDFADFTTDEIIARAIGAINHAVSMWPEGKDKSSLAEAIRARAWEIEQEGRPAKEQGRAGPLVASPLPDTPPIRVVYETETSRLDRLKAVADTTSTLFRRTPRPEPKMLTVVVGVPDEGDAAR